MDEEDKFDDDKSVKESDNKNSISADLIRGHINTIILRALYERDKYGYEIIEEIEKKSHGQYVLKQPTLYSALKRLESQGYINAYWKTDEVSLGGRRKYYTLTDSGREIAEKNQAEWEYSRTVIDNLISDRSFDFSMPAPSAVDFKILKKSTSRVPLIKKETDDDFDDEDEDDDDFNDEELDDDDLDNDDDLIDEENIDNRKTAEEDQPQLEINAQPTIYVDQVAYYNPSPSSPLENKNEVQYNNSPSVKENQVEKATEINEPVEDKIDDEPPMDEEQRRIVHENYLRLISEPVRRVEPEDVVPVADEIDTDKLIYNNKPETERDYRNLINNLFSKTVSSKPSGNVTEQFNERQYPTEPVLSTNSIKLEDVNTKADKDGLKVNTADCVITGSRRKIYNRGASLFKSSLIIAIILLLEFTLCLIFKNELGITIAYPFVILAIAAAQLLIFGVLYYTDLGKNSRKPSSLIYLSACIILDVIILFIIFIVSLLLNVNFNSAGDIMAKIVIPCIISLNIPAFAVCFYLFSR